MNHLKFLQALLPFLWEQRGKLFWSLAFLILAKIALVILPVLLKNIVDSLDLSLENPVLVLPLFFLIAYGLLRLSNVLFSELRDFIFSFITQRTIRRIVHRVFVHLHNLSLRFHLERKTGSVSRDIERGSQSLSFILSFLIFNIIPNLLELLLVSIILFVLLDFWFAVVAFAAIIVYSLFTYFVTEWRNEFVRRKNNLESEANGKAIDSLLNYETVKYFANENFEARRYDEGLAKVEQAGIANQRSLSILNLGQGAIISFSITIMLLMAANGVVTGQLTLGDLVMVNAYLLQLFAPLGFLGFVYREMKNSLTSLERMFDLLERQPEIQDAKDATALQVTHGEIRFENISFSYDEQRTILNNISFSVPAGKKIAIVGHSGAGKSSIVKLLFRFYDPQAGRITIDGQDIKYVTQNSLRQAIGIVPQDTVLFNDTLYYNLSYAHPDAAEEQVKTAATRAYLSHFIQKLPQGFASLVGERGLKLSGGEKQRVGIARVLLKNPPILIFDEATSSLDSKAEQAILDSLQEVAENHTTLVIAHRLSTVVDADEILVLEQGQIIERGNHQSLISVNGYYAELWQLQLREEEEKVTAS